MIYRGRGEGGERGGEGERGGVFIEKERDRRKKS